MGLLAVSTGLNRSADHGRAPYAGAAPFFGGEEQHTGGAAASCKEKAGSSQGYQQGLRMTDDRWAEIFDLYLSSDTDPSVDSRMLRLATEQEAQNGR